PADKRIEASLTYIYGIGFSTARRILEQTNIDPNLRAKNLTPQQINEIIHAITNNKIKIEGDLRRDIQGNLKRLQAINCYRGQRHLLKRQRPSAPRQSQPKSRRSRLSKRQLRLKRLARISPWMPTRLRSQKLLRRKAPRTFIPASRTFTRVLTTPSSRSQI